MNKYSYYTPEELADEIVKLLPKREYGSVIDICCGTWNLLSAAYKKYPMARFFGVDTDESIAEHVFADAEFILNDGREFAAREKREGRTYDLILSNPPFGNLDDSEVYWNNKSPEIEFSALRCKRYEAEMMLANIYLAHKNSVLVFILPITFVKGESFRKARRQIANAFNVLQIIELPINTFKGNRLKTVAIILEKERNSKRKANYKKATLDKATWKFVQVCKITYKDIKTGNWTGEKINKGNLEIKRGMIHSGEMGSGKNIVLHCSSTIEKGKWRPSVRYTNKPIKIKAEDGDILINRIGRGAGYWCINDRDNVGVSDCLFVIKNTNKDLIKKLCDNTVEGKLNISARGVSTMYITQADICSIINN